MIVDHEAMRMAHSSVPVPGRTVVSPHDLGSVKVVIAWRMRVFHFLVLVFELLWIMPGPERHRGECTERGKDCKDEVGRAHLKARTEPTSGGIGDQPAGMRQGELGSKQCGPVFGM